MISIELELVDLIVTSLGGADGADKKLLMELPKNQLLFLYALILSAKCYDQRWQSSRTSV